MKRMLAALLVTCPLAHGAFADGAGFALPVDGQFGTETGCEILAEFEIPAIVEAGGTEEIFGSHQGVDNPIVVTEEYLAGPDWVCEPGAVDGQYVALDCVSWGATWIPMPIARFEKKDDGLILTMDDEPPVSLEFCSQGYSAQPGVQTLR
jgi:hypothetical protein